VKRGKLRCTLSSLGELNLRYNKISNIQEDFLLDNVPKPQALGLSGNNLHFLADKSFDNFKHLENLNLAQQKNGNSWLTSTQRH
jgi:hypothetical protein